MRHKKKKKEKLGWLQFALNLARVVHFSPAVKVFIHRRARERNIKIAKV